MENCLADTGMGQNSVLIIAVIISVFGIGLFLLSRHYKLRGSLLAVVLLFIAVMVMGTQPVAAQSADCQGDDEAPTTTSLRLIDDTYEGGLDGDFVVPIIANDLFKSGDPIDWDTLDLDASTPGVDSNAILYHADSPDYACGGVYYDYGITPETVFAYASASCFNDSDEIPLSSTLSFRYTARSQSGKKAPEPATATITFEGVYAIDHSILIDFNASTANDVNVSDSAVAIGSTVDPDSVDLDPSTPGRQTSIILPAAYDPDIDVTVEVDSNGVVTVSVGSTGSTSCSSGAVTDPFPYTIQSVSDVTSNQAMITVSYTNNCA